LGISLPFIGVFFYSLSCRVLRGIRVRYRVVIRGREPASGYNRSNMKQLGRYEIERELGRGAMGVVYAAMDPLIGRQVAIKAIRLGALDIEANHAELTERLHREARAAGVLSHPGIITIHDVGSQGENAYIVMEFIDGKTLEEMLAPGIPQRSGTLLSILRKCGEALDYAHARGIIHRDIKPSNIMICFDGAVKIADFGVAKLTASTSLTQSGFVLGTPSYMSPEQAQGRPIDGHSDQFSLAVVAYRMLTGKLPFEGATLTALLAKILWEEPEYDSAGLQSPIRPVFEKALAKEPKLRYPNCIDFVRALETAYTGGRPESSEDIPLAAETGAAAPKKLENDSVHPSPIARPLAQQKAGRKTPRIAWIAILAFAAVALAVFWGIKAKKVPALPAPKAAADIAATAPKGAPAIIAPAEPVRQPEKQEDIAEPQPIPKRPAPAKPAAMNMPIPAPKQPETHAVQLHPASGVITWSGSLEKNSVLVITDKGVTIGSITGQLPGKPVHIEVEPRDITIRQKPGENNHWDQMILYSGNQRYTSITIHWKILD
jgi:tRNA A-37 threonylcarbamoyl transferase component Bud32